MEGERPPLRPNFNSPDFYKRLGVDPYAATGEIKDAFRALSSKLHPDKNGALDARTKRENEANLKLISQAYNQLKTEAVRRSYDRKNLGFNPGRDMERRRREEAYAARKAEAQRQKEEREKAERIVAQERAAQEQAKNAAKEELEKAKKAAEERTAQEQARVAREAEEQRQKEEREGAEKAAQEREAAEAAAQAAQAPRSPEPPQMSAEDWAEAQLDSSTRGKKGGKQGPAPKRKSRKQQQAEAEFRRENGRAPGPEASDQGETVPPPEEPSAEAPQQEAAPAPDGGASTTEANEPEVTPPELAEIFGENVPREALETWKILKSKKTKEDYLAKLRADEAERKAREASEATATQTAQGNQSSEPPPSGEPEPDAEPQSQTEPPAGADAEPQGNPDVKPEDTRAGWYAQLREAVGKVVAGTKEKVSSAAEVVSEKFAKSKEYLNSRAKEIDAQAETSGAEKVVRRMGEIYNKLNWREKLGIGLVLGASAVVTGGVSVYPYMFTGLIGAQRAFGMASMYLSQEKALLSAKVTTSNQFISAKERASVDAVMSGALMGAAIGKGIQLANEYGLVERTREWLGNMLGHELVPPSESTKLATAQKNIPGAPQPAAAAAAGAAAPEVVAPPAPEVPNISVEATKGHGYEYMMKRLWEQLHDPEKHFTPPQNLDPNSDLARLLDVKPGDEAGINTLVHDLATDNEFYKENGTNVRIDMGSKMTVDAKGNLWLGDDIIAPANAPVTPAYHPEAPATAPGITPPPHVETVDLTAAQDEAAKHISPPPLQEAPAPEVNAPVDSSGNPVHAGVSESLPGANSFGIVVPETIPHIYADPTADRLFAYGGSPAERTTVISEYLMRNPDKIVFAADETGKYRIPWHLVEGKIVAGPPMRTNGILGFFSTHLTPPGPEEFRKVIK